jgi:hypothetical protein
MERRGPSVSTVIASWTIAIVQGLTRIVGAAFSIEEQRPYRPDAYYMRGLVRNGARNTPGSVKGETRTQRFASSEELWKWIDAHQTELGVGRPYLDRDPALQSGSVGRRPKPGGCCERGP